MSKKTTKKTNDSDELFISKISSNFSSYVIDHSVRYGEVTYVVKPEYIKDICNSLKSDPDLKMNFLSDVIGVDLHPRKPRFEVVYQLLSISEKLRLRVKVCIEDGQSVESVTSVWSAADWAEREVYDMFGIVFDNHPDLRRIYMPEDWDGFPLRKDYPLRGYKDRYNPNGEEKKD